MRHINTNHINIMGDRANIVIEKDTGMFPHEVYFYTHWHGRKIKPILKAALIKGVDRWDDPQYLSRVIFCELVSAGKDEVTGFGITTAIGDGGYKLLCVNMEEKKVRVRDSGKNVRAPVLKEWSFEDYCAVEFTDDDDE